MLGTPLSSSIRSRSCAKSTSAAKSLTSPSASAVAWSSSRHHVARIAAPAALSPMVYPPPRISGCGSSRRGPTLTIAARDGLAPPGVSSLAEPGFGARYVPASGSHRPTPTVVRTVEVPGSQATCGTSTVTWRRSRSMIAPGAGSMASPVAASRSSAVSPCQVRKCSAGDRTPASCGQSTAVPPSPSAMVNAVRSGACRVLSVTRNTVASSSGLTRSSTRSAPLCAKAGSVG
jgi:hypothetical protein